MNIEELRTYCLSMDNTSEDIKWDQVLTFCVHQKIFALSSLDEVPTNVSFKTSEEDFNELIEQDGIKPAPYLGRNKWVQVRDIDTLPNKVLQNYLLKSYQLISTKSKKK